MLLPESQQTQRTTFARETLSKWNGYLPFSRSRSLVPRYRSNDSVSRLRKLKLKFFLAVFNVVHASSLLGDRLLGIVHGFDGVRVSYTYPTFPIKNKETRTLSFIGVEVKIISVDNYVLRIGSRYLAYGNSRLLKIQN